MTNDLLLQGLYPDAIASIPLRGRYLAENLHQQGNTSAPYIYANYVSSLDGRIAIAGEDGHSHTPHHLTTPSDWTLFKELQAQADCLITHTGYLRALANKSQGNILQIPGDDQNLYLHQWRKKAALPRQPHVLIISRTLDFTWPVSLDTQKQPVSVLTTASENHSAVATLRAQGADVFFVDTPNAVTAKDVMGVLKYHELRTAYLQTGPELLHSLLTLDVVRRLYLTLNLSLVGGADFLTMLAGNLPSNRKSMQLRSLYLRNTTTAITTNSSTEDAQLFAAFDL